MPISVSDPVSAAIRRAKLVTFQPFSIGKWFSLGFCAFLATLGEGASFNFNSGGGWGGGGGGGRRMPAPGTTPNGRIVPPAPPDPVGMARDWVVGHVGASVLIGLAIVLVLVAVYLVLVWLSSRGRFMFLDGVARNTAEVVAPWKRYRPLGNSLFKFYACLAAVSVTTFIAISALAVAIGWSDIQAQRFGSAGLTAVLVGAGLLLPLWILFALVLWCTNTLVVPIMYATGATVRPAWRDFRTHVLAGHVGNLFLFMLMSGVLSVAVGVLALVAGCATLCIGFLPYLSTVVTLPLHVFRRAYSVYYLQQFDPRYAIMIEEPASYGFAVIMPAAPVVLPPPPIE